MTDEGVRRSGAAVPSIPPELGWPSLLPLHGKALKDRYESNLHELGHSPGVLGAIYDRAQNRIEDADKLRHLVDLINAEQWLDLGEDVKGSMYEGLLQKNAEDVKSGAGQYFTPRPLIEAIVECVRPQPMKTIADPACGTGGFFLGAYQWLMSQRPGLKVDEEEFLRNDTFYGNEIVADTRRLALMNLMLHGIGNVEDEPVISRSDALVAPSPVQVDYVFANPPFGRRSAFSARSKARARDTGEPFLERPDFWVSTGNKQLDFLQHIFSMLKVGGEAAVILPDNVLFEGGASERIRRELLARCDVHTLLRLPAGIFYAGGVQANVLFFTRAEESEVPATKAVWVYDFRTDVRFTRVRAPLERHHLDDFVLAYKSEDRATRQETSRFQRFDYGNIISRPNSNMDFTWQVDATHRSSNLQDAGFMRREIVEHLLRAVEAFDRIELDSKR